MSCLIFSGQMYDAPRNPQINDKRNRVEPERKPMCVPVAEEVRSIRSTEA